MFGKAKHKAPLLPYHFQYKSGKHQEQTTGILLPHNPATPCESPSGQANFKDCRNLPSQDYAQDMKFWWPQTEAIIATLYAYLMTKEEKYLKMHQQISEWTYTHFPDKEYGEWYGYLHRDGTVAQPAKGNLFKGPFHIPRMMTKGYMLCEEIMSEIKKEIR